MALSVKEEALKQLPDEIHPVDLCAMQYVWNRNEQPEQSWKGYYVTIVGFPRGDPLTVSSGKIKGEKGGCSYCPILNFEDHVTAETSSSYINCISR